MTNPFIVYQTLLFFFFIEGEGDELNQASSQQQQQPKKIKKLKINKTQQSCIPISQLYS